MTKQVRKPHIFRSFATGSLALLVALLIQGGTSYAEDTACDPQFMDALDARAFTEAARENGQNENLIFKPDSVLEYSCFTDHAPNTLKTAALKFYPHSLEDPSTTPAQNFIGANFGHDYLNNRYKDPGNEGTGFCEIMHKVFKANRCMNFYNRIDLDTMYDLSWYTRNDPRKLPVECEKLPYFGIDGDSPNMAVDIAYNGRAAIWTQGPYMRDNINYKADPAKLMNEMFLPGQCGTAIPTGMIVVDYDGGPASYAEKTCANPACVYIPSSDRCEMR